MPVYRVECAHRTTGAGYPVIIESLSAKDAADYCVAQGHLVGRVLTEVPHFPITGAAGDPNGHAAPHAAPSSPTDSAQAHEQPHQVAALLAHAHATPSSGHHMVHDSPTHAETLRDIADRLARLQRSPIIARPTRTIAYGMILGFSLMWGLALLLMLLLLILGITLPLSFGGPNARPAEGINAGDLQRVQDLLKP